MSLDGQLKPARLLLAIILSFIAALPALAGPHLGAPPSKDDGPGYAPGRIIVKFASAPTVSRGPKGEVTVNKASVDRLGARFGVKDMQLVFRHASKAKSIPPGLAKKLGSTYTVTYSGKADPRTVAKEYARLAEVEYAEPDYVRRAFRVDPDDPYWLSNNSWGQNYRDQWDMEMMKCPDAWDIETGDASVVIAVIDTGIDYNHADIAANMWQNPGEIPGNGLDDDSNGHIDDFHGYDFAYKDSNPMDGNGHGTHVAGTIGAVGNNGTGIAGVNWVCRLMAVKGLDDTGSGYDSDLADAIIYAVAEGASIINMSWGGPGFSQTVHQVLAQAHLQGVTLVAAAGNSSVDLAGFHPASDNYVITVSASDPNDQACSFTNWGIKTAVAAPGGNGPGTSPACAVYNCLSLRAGTTDPLSGDCGPGVGVVGENYYRLGGTSMACPHVAGLAGLLKALHPTWTNEQIRQAIQMRADDIRSAGFDSYAGFGRVNAYSSLTSGEPMTAIITSPNNGAEISGQFPIQGTASGPSFGQWILDCGPGHDPTTWTTIADGFAPVVRGTLATWDVTNVTSGLHTLRLRVSGNGGAQSAEYRMAVTPKSTEGSGHFTELFDSAPFDLANKSLRFTPDGSNRFYSFCVVPIMQLPTDPTNGTALLLPDDGSELVTLGGGAQVSLYGISRNQFHVGSNGYITFDTGDNAYLESFSNHFSMKRISALFDDLTPAANVSWKQLPDRVAVSFVGITEYNVTTTNTFQIEMFFDGRITLSYLSISASDGLIGLSAGLGVPSDFVDSDLSGYPGCVSVGRVLALTRPNGGECYEPGSSVSVIWTYAGTSWTAGDTVRLQYSADSGETWAPIAGAQNLPFNAGSFVWSTDGLANDTRYRVRVLFNGDDTVGDDSNADFTIGPDTVPPQIEHTPLPDTSRANGPYDIQAVVTDNLGVGSVTLFWNKNGGAFSSAPMVYSESSSRYQASIPGPSVVGDRYCYYIEAVDSSSSHNTARLPAESAQTFCFNIVEYMDYYTQLFDTEALDLQNMSIEFIPDGSDNFYAACSHPITELPTDPGGGALLSLGDDSFVEYRIANGEMVSLYGVSRDSFYVGSNGYITFDSGDNNWSGWLADHFLLPRISAMFADLSPADNVSILQLPDRVAVTYQGIREYGTTNTNTFQIELFYDGSLTISYLSTGTSRCLAGLSRGLGLPADFVESSLSSYPCGPRLTMIGPDGGEFYEPGNTVQIRWMAVGSDWQMGDAVRLEASYDGGSTWTQITGAGNLPHDQSTFDWDTSGWTPSTRYRVRVSAVDDPGISDASNGDFTIAVDMAPPVIIHSPLGSTNNTDGPYRVDAQITDDLGISSAVLYWSRNGEPFSAAPMSASGIQNGYRGDIPGPSESCTDSYSYYIVATDSSAAVNSTRSPATGEYSFSIAGPTIGVGHSNLLFEIPPGGSASDTITLYNTGCTPLEWQIVERADASIVYEDLDVPIAAARPDVDWSRPHVPGRLIVGIKPGLQSVQRAAMHAQAGAKVVRSFGLVCADVVKVDVGVDMKAVAAAYAAMPGVKYVEPDYIVSGFKMPGDPLFASQWALDNTGQTGGTPDADIDAVEAWDTVTGGSDVVVAVIDSGVCYTHPDLAANMWQNTGEIPGNGVDDDLNGFVDDVFGYDFANDDADPMDDSEHGTHVAGIIGAVGGNELGVSGVNWNVRIMALKFLGADGRGSITDAVSCLEYSLDMGARITSNSWGSGAYSQTLEEAIGFASDAGQLFIAAAGNDGVDTDTAPSYPSCYVFPNIISVAATDHNDDLAQWVTGGGSNRGLNTVDLAAPGKDILSTVPESGYLSMEGTSMAAPFVAGACALCMYASPAATWQQVKQWVMNSVDPKPSLNGKMVTGGRLNVSNALALAGMPWLEETPKSGVIPPGESVAVVVRADATGLNDGTAKSGSIAIRSNDYATPTVVIPVFLNVVQSGRFLRLDSPNGGEWFQPGEAINIAWSLLGTDWLPGDTVKILASYDGGSTWVQIPGAENLDCFDHSYTWQSAGWPQSSKYRIKISFMANESIADSSDGNFTIATDVTPPDVTHTPLADSGNLSGPYTVYAGVTDNYAVGSVMIYWQRNGGTFSSVAMSPTDVPHQYAGQIPGPSTDGDRYCYYIVAADASVSHNSTLEPTGAPAEVHCFIVRSAVDLPVNLFDVDGSRWDIQQNGSITDGSSDAFDGGFVLSGFPNLSSGAIEEVGREIVITNGALTGIRLTRKIYVPADRSYCRFLEIVRNMGGTPVNHTVRIDTNLGSDSATQVVGTSDGDGILETGDQWIVTDDLDGMNDPVVTHVMAGPGASLVPSQASYTPGFVGYAYDLTLAPGETRIIMHFGAQDVYRVGALAKAAQLAGLAADQNCLAGMTAFERARVANFVTTGRTLAIVAPNGGEWFEPESSMTVQWMAVGADWQAGDTVNLELSRDNGGTWAPIPGAGALDYSAGSFIWNTAGVPPSSNCLIKVTATSDSSVNDASDGTFVIATDTTPPSITHTPLGDTNDLSGPYPVCAHVTDNLGIGSVTLYWSKNGGAFSPVVMLPPNGTGEYCGSIPGPSAGGDRYCYYIVATDASAAHHTTMEPAGAPAQVHSFAVRHIVSLPLVLADGDGMVWDIQRTGSILEGSGDSLDGGFALFGFPAVTTGQFEDGEREVVISDGGSAGIQVTRKVYVPADRAYARFLEIVTNASDSPAAYTVRIESNLGSDLETVVVGTSDGNTVFGTSDTWIVTDDGDGGGDLPVAHVIAGTAAGHAPDSVSLNGDTLSYAYSLDLAPYETQIVMHFGVQSPDRASALSKAAQLTALNTSQNCLFGMTQAERSQVVNFVATGMMLTLTAPNGGEVFTSGDLVPIRWSAIGPEWKTGDTVRLERSPDDGATWAVIPGASGIAFDSGLYNWHTAGSVGSNSYRIRVARNGQVPVSDTSDAPFAIVTPESVRGCKLKSDTTAVSVANKRVSAVFSDCFYVQEDDRSSGIGVLWSTTKPDLGDLATLTGQMVTVDGERMIQGLSLNWSDPDATLPAPLGINGRSIGGTDFEYSEGPPAVGQRGMLGKIGLNNVGLLVKMWGTVIGVDPSPMPLYFVITDGYDYLKVDLIPDALAPQQGDLVSVVGISSCEPDGAYLRPKLKLRSGMDIVNLSQQ